MILWRRMQAEDLTQVLALADILHPDHPERIEIFADKLDFCPQGCGMAQTDAGIIAGYAFCHHWRVGAPPPLDAPLPALDRPADCLHLHDIALLPEYRGCGAPMAFLGIMEELAQSLGLDQLTLVAIKGRSEYWRRKGFAPALLAREGQDILTGYGAGAVYMTRRTGIAP